MISPNISPFPFLPSPPLSHGTLVCREPTKNLAFLFLMKSPERICFLLHVNKIGAKESQRKMSILHRCNFLWGERQKCHHFLYSKNRQMHHCHMDGNHLTNFQYSTLTTSLKLCPCHHQVSFSNVPDSWLV